MFTILGHLVGWLRSTWSRDLLVWENPSSPFGSQDLGVCTSWSGRGNPTWFTFWAEETGHQLQIGLEMLKFFCSRSTFGGTRWSSGSQVICGCPTAAGNNEYQWISVNINEYHWTCILRHVLTFVVCAAVPWCPKYRLCPPDGADFPRTTGSPGLSPLPLESPLDGRSFSAAAWSLAGHHGNRWCR